MRVAFLTLILLLSGCGGGGNPPAPVAPAAPVLLKALVQPSDRVVDGAGYDLQIQPLAEPDPAASVLAQSRLGGNVMLWAGFTKGEGFDRFPAFVEQARKYPNITHAYVYDELFWTGQETVIGLDEAAILQAAQLARAAGLKTVVTLMPDVVLDPAFRLADGNAFDAIGLDVYPSARPHIVSQLGTCRYSDNLYSNLFYCAARKLRAQGYTGQIWYVYQAFGSHQETADQLRRELTLQRETINDAARLGADGIVPWGLHLGAEQIAAEPFLYQLAGTDLEGLVAP